MKFLPFFIVFVSCWGFGQGKAPRANKLYCHLFETVNLHSTPDINSTVIAEINYQDTVYLREKTNHGIKNHPLGGRFYKVFYKGKTGYATNSAFIKHPPADTSGRYQYFIDYLFDKFPYLGGDERFEIPDDYNEGFKKKCYFYGFTYTFSGTECDLNETISTRLLDVEQAIRLFKLVNQVYHDIPLDYSVYEKAEDEYGKECLGYNYTREVDPFWTNHYCLMKLHKVGIEWAQFHWDWEAGGGSLEFKQDKKGNTVITHTYGCH